MKQNLQKPLSFLLLFTCFALPISGEEKAKKIVPVIEKKRLKEGKKSLKKSSNEKSTAKNKPLIASQGEKILWSTMLISGAVITISLWALFSKTDKQACKDKIAAYEWEVLTHYWQQKYNQPDLACGSLYDAQKEEGYIYARAYALSFYPRHKREKRRLRNEAMDAYRNNPLLNIYDVNLNPEVPQLQKEVMMRVGKQEAQAAKNQLEENYKKNAIDDLTKWTEETKKELKTIMKIFNVKVHAERKSMYFFVLYFSGEFTHFVNQITKFYQNEIDTLDKKLAQAKKERKEALSVFANKMLLPNEDYDLFPKPLEDIILSYA